MCLSCVISVRFIPNKETTKSLLNTKNNILILLKVFTMRIFCKKVKKESTELNRQILISKYNIRMNLVNYK